MNQTDFDRTKFVKDGYGHLSPKKQPEKCCGKTMQKIGEYGKRVVLFCSVCNTKKTI